MSFNLTEFAKTIADDKGKQKKVYLYDEMMTPYERGMIQSCV